MTKNPKNNLFKPDKYWKNIYKIDFEYEKLIYQYLCGYISKKKASKLKTEHKFKSYGAWEEYIRLKHSNWGDLYEFKRYLNLKKRSKSGYKEFYSLLTIPVIVALLADNFLAIIIDPISFIVDLKFIKNIEFINNFPDLVSQILYSTINFTITFFIVMLLSMFLVILIYKPISHFWDANNENYFFKDYIEIIDKILDEENNITRICKDNNKVF